MFAVAVACGGSPPPAPPSHHATAPHGDAAPAAMPAEVERLVERWEMCQHWAGEEPYDQARRAELEAGVAASCPGNDETRARLEAKYADRADVIAKLRALPE
jgi:hypothetical protein